MADIIITQQQIKIKRLLKIRLIVFCPVTITLIFIRIKHPGHTSPLPTRFNRRSHLKQSVFRQHIIMVQQPNIVPCGIE